MRAEYTEFKSRLHRFPGCCGVKRAAFTLIELMIAMLVWGIALVGILGAFTACLNLNETARNLTIAINHAQGVMEEIRDQNIAAIITVQDWTAWAQADPPAGGGCNSLENEMVQVSYPSGAGARPLEILVTVNWTQKGRAQSTQVTTLLAER